MSNADSGLSTELCPDLDTNTRHPCGGCDFEMTRQTWGGALLRTAAGNVVPLCPACRVRAGSSHLFADAIRQAADAGATLPGVLACFKRAGRAVPADIAAAAAMLGDVEAGRSNAP